MKSLVLSMLAIASMAAMSSCSNENDVIDDVTGGNQDKVEIKLSAGTIGVETKAPIVDLTGLANSDQKIGIYAIDDNTWTATPRIANQSSSTNTSGNITFDDSKKYYYPGTGDVNFYAYFPYEGTDITAPSEGTAPSVSFTITGQEDLMYATPVSGNKTTPPANTLKFNHALTQIQFKVKAGSIPNDVTLTSIKVTGVNDQCKMDIATGALSAWGKSKSAKFDASVTGTLTIGEEATVGSPIMLQPEQTSFKIEVVTSMGTYSDISITPTGGDSKFAAGKSYNVLLTFNATGIDVKADITAWTPNGTGEGTVE
ncbi:fimbrillin family protein [uncultured Parabacteroides sp.]|uniref:fimbrillin family protein n=1 Tax=uncultured Parabacteroides sp. TaxID=512312 RepID=UPI00261CE46D|nr:fimbrillin family protein [uncultured Parabacteroides sp.]